MNTGTVNKSQIFRFQKKKKCLLQLLNGLHNFFVAGKNAKKFPMAQDTGDSPVKLIFSIKYCIQLTVKINPFINLGRLPMSCTIEIRHKVDFRWKLKPK